MEVRESTRNNILYKVHEAIRGKEDKRKEAIASSRSSKCDQKKPQQLKQNKTARRIRKSLECRQLEKLRNTSFVEDRKAYTKLETKVEFLDALNLQPKTIHL